MNKRARPEWSTSAIPLVTDMFLLAFNDHSGESQLVRPNLCEKFPVGRDFDYSFQSYVAYLTVLRKRILQSYVS